ncbi:MAG: divergent polysaccharide deacetylase family protein [Deferribacteraceae bacterium]|jgi:polysaccharide deacetylase 2 family uncharacterized protein YibQ|nr:divergent polysaccharide deacetylase family protein [Deferribacteraceae bacterium]
MKSRLQDTADKIFNKIRGGKTAAAVILAATVVLLAVAAAFLIIYAPPYPPSAADNLTDNLSTPKEITYDDLHSRIRLILFDYNLTAEHLSESVSSAGGKLEYTLALSSVPREKMRSVEADLFNLLNLNRMSPELLPNMVRGENTQFIINLIFVLPETPVDNLTPQPYPPAEDYPFGVPFPPYGKGAIALLIDDAGMNLALADRLSKLNIPLTFAIIPHTTYAKDTAELVRARGKSVFLHFPMQPDGYPNIDPGEGAVLIDMPQTIIEMLTDSNVANIGEIDGANNHMGSTVTADAEKIRQVLIALSRHTDTFVDSKTSPNTAAYRVCKELGLKCAQNQRFLDNENNRAYIAKKLYEALVSADRGGAMVVIGHLRIDTVVVLETVVPELLSRGYKFMPVKELAR